MARPLRIQHAGAIYHLMARGNNKQAVYRSDRDRQRWLQLLSTTCERFDWHILAWCQMGNHYHLVARTNNPTLSLGMRHLNGCYTQWFNHEHQNVGHVYQGRFRSELVDTDSYLVELARYVLLNPVRGELVRDPADWLWSSYRATMAPSEAPPWLSTEPILRYFGDPSSAAARKAFRRFLLLGSGTFLTPKA